MTFKQVRGALFAPLEWSVSQIRKRPALMVWTASLALVAWVF